MMLNLLRDIKSGALPPSEWAGFAIWALGKSFWFFIALICAGAISLLIIR